jgi:hypothetical protein
MAIGFQSTHKKPQQRTFDKADFIGGVEGLPASQR